MSTIQGKGRCRAKGKAKVMGSRKLTSMAKAKGHAIPSPLSWRDIWKIKKDDSMMVELFKEWMRDNNRIYPTNEEEEQRFRVFKVNAQYALDHYDERGKICRLDVFADMSNDEFEAVFVRKGITYDSGSDLDVMTTSSSCPV